MKVRLLRNLGNDLVKQLTADGVKLPDDGIHEGKVVEVKDDMAKTLFELSVAEAETFGDGGPGTRVDADSPRGQEGTWQSSTARENQEAEALKRQAEKTEKGKK